MSIWEYILLFGSALIGAVASSFTIRKRDDILQFLLSFSGSYLLGVTVLHLIPSLYSNTIKGTGFFMLGGFLIQLLLEQLSRGVEHGHMHFHKEEGKVAMAISVLAGLGLHAFMEGLPLDYYDSYHLANHGHDHGSHNHFLWAIILHKIPAAFALMSLLSMANFNKKTVWIAIIIFAAMSPLGALLGSMLDFDEQSRTWTLALISGSLLHISTTILFEADKSKQHKVSLKKFITILIGILMALTSTL
jgi:zinc transporter ZupT